MDISHLIPQYLLNSTIYYINVIDLNQNYIFVNDLFKQRFSFLADEFTGLSFYISVHPDDVEKYKQATLECINHPGKSVSLQIRKPYQEDNIFYTTQWEFSLLVDKNAQTVGIFCLGYDFTPTKQAIQKALEFERITNLIIEHIYDGFFVLDRQWRFIKINQAMSIILGIETDKLIGENIWRFFADDEHFNYPKAYRQAMNEQTTAYFEDYFQGKWIDGAAYGSPEGLLVFFRDVSPRRLVEQQLKDSEKKLRAMMDSTADASILIAPNYQIIFFNKSAYDDTLTMYQQEISIGTNILTILPEKAHQLLKQQIEQAKNGEVLRLEIPVSLSNNQSAWRRITYFPVYTADNQLLGVGISTIDIDQQKKAEEKIRNSENRLRAILDSTPDYNVLIGKDFKVLSFNKTAALETMKLWNQQIKIGDDFLTYIRDDFRTGFVHSFQQAMKGKTIEKEVEADFGNQQKFWFKMSYFPVYDAENQLIGISFNSTNITERKNAEAKLKDSENKLRAMLNSKDEIKIFIDKNCKILYFNNSFQEIVNSLGLTTIDIGSDLREYLPPQFADDLEQEIQTAMQGKITHEQRYVNLPDRQAFWAEISYFPVYNDSYQLIGVSIYIFNINERKLAELALVDKNQRLREIAQIQSHEVRRPVSNILGLVNLIKDYPIDSELVFLLDFLKINADQLDEIIHRVVRKADELD